MTIMANFRHSFQVCSQSVLHKQNFLKTGLRAVKSQTDNLTASYLTASTAVNEVISIPTQSYTGICNDKVHGMSHLSYTTLRIYLHLRLYSQADSSGQSKKVHLERAPPVQILSSSCSFRQKFLC